MRIAVAGGTGTVGRHVVEVARERGHDVVVLARSEGVDLLTGDGLAQRLDGIDTVVDTTNVVTRSREEATTFFAEVTRHLLGAEAAVGVAHHVLLSIVGIEGVDTGYYAGKRVQETATEQGGVPWSVLRATQFHEFAEQALGFVTVGPFSLVPRMLSQPIAAREVAEALVDLAVAGPSGRVPELAGPEQLQMVDLARRVSRARGLRRRVIGLTLPGAAGKGMRDGLLLPRSAGPRGRVAFDAWLSQP